MTVSSTLHQAAATLEEALRQVGSRSEHVGAVLNFVKAILADASVADLLAEVGWVESELYLAATLFARETAFRFSSTAVHDISRSTSTMIKDAAGLFYSVSASNTWTHFEPVQVVLEADQGKLLAECDSLDSFRRIHPNLSRSWVFSWEIAQLHRQINVNPEKARERAAHKALGEAARLFHDSDTPIFHFDLNHKTLHHILRNNRYIAYRDMRASWESYELYSNVVKRIVLAAPASVAAYFPVGIAGKQIGLFCFFCERPLKDAALEKLAPIISQMLTTIHTIEARFLATLGWHYSAAGGRDLLHGLASTLIQTQQNLASIVGDGVVAQVTENLQSALAMTDQLEKHMGLGILERALVSPSSLQDSLEALGKQFGDGNATFRCKYGNPSCDVEVLGSERQLANTIYEFVRNACNALEKNTVRHATRFLPHGYSGEDGLYVKLTGTCIVIDCVFEELIYRPNQRGLIEITIFDNGVGIDSHIREELGETLLFGALPSARIRGGRGILSAIGTIRLKYDGQARYLHPLPYRYGGWVVEVFGKSVKCE